MLTSFSRPVPTNHHRRGCSSRFLCRNDQTTSLESELDLLGGKIYHDWSRDYFKILDEKPKLIEINQPIHLPQIRGKVELKNVWFKYPEKSGQDVFVV